jgi:hypothetical protein
MDMEEVIEIINDRWGTPVINRAFGFRHPNPSRSPLDYDMRVGPLIVGEQSVRLTHIHSIPLFLDRTVRISWGFDENGKLLDVYVESWYVI